MIMLITMMHVLHAWLGSFRPFRKMPVDLNKPAKKKKLPEKPNPPGIPSRKILQWYPPSAAPRPNQDLAPLKIRNANRHRLVCP